MAFNDSFYAHEYEINHVKEVIGISCDDLNKATEVLLDYIKDDIDNLDVEVVINGQQKQMYNQREIDHMVDVKALYLNVRNISYGAFALVVIIGAYIDMNAATDNGYNIEKKEQQYILKEQEKNND